MTPRLVDERCQPRTSHTCHRARSSVRWRNRDAGARDDSPTDGDLLALGKARRRRDRPARPHGAAPAAGAAIEPHLTSTGRRIRSVAMKMAAARACPRDENLTPRSPHADRARTAQPAALSDARRWLAEDMAIRCSSSQTRGLVTSPPAADSSLLRDELERRAASPPRHRDGLRLQVAREIRSKHRFRF
jgi:hypothetical protein